MQSKITQKRLLQWQMIVGRMLYPSRKALCNEVWTAWMRVRTALRKIRNAFWSEWTRQQFEPKPLKPTTNAYRQLGFADLGKRSYRDGFITRKASGLIRHVKHGSQRFRPVMKWLGGGDWVYSGEREDPATAIKLIADGWTDQVKLLKVDEKDRQTMLEGILKALVDDPDCPNLRSLYEAIAASMGEASASELMDVQVSRMLGEKSKGKEVVASPSSMKPKRKPRRG